MGEVVNAATWWDQQASLLGAQEDIARIDTTNGQTADRWRLFSDSEIEQQPPRRDLIAGILPYGSLAFMVGAPATAKTTLAMDMAFSVATNTSWHGHSVLDGPVVIVAAEGSGGLGPRVRAWKHARGRRDGALVYFLPRAVNLMDRGEVDAFLRAMAAALPAPPVLIVFDTLARCLVGGEENSAKDMGLWIAGADFVREMTGTTVLVVHHTGKAGNKERGSSALRGAADTILLVEREDEMVTIACDKQKDGLSFTPLRLGLLVVELPDGASACTLTPDVAHARRRAPGLGENRRKALDAVRDLDHGEGATRAEWLRACGLSESTFHRVLRDLEGLGLVKKAGKGQRVRYFALSIEKPNGASDAEGRDTDSLPTAKSLP